MLSKEEILQIAKDSLKEFNLKIEVKFLPPNLFLEQAKKSPLISQALKEGNSFDELNIPALVYHEKKDHIYFSEDILKKLIDDEPITIQKRFIKSIIYHEIFHVIYKKKIKNFNFNSAFNQEEFVSAQFRREYPGLEALGRRISKKYLNF